MLKDQGGERLIYCELKHFDPWQGLHLKGTIMEHVQRRAIGVKKSYQLREVEGRGFFCFSGAGERLGTKVTDPLSLRAGMCTLHETQCFLTSTTSLVVK